MWDRILDPQDGRLVGISLLHSVSRLPSLRILFVTLMNLLNILCDEYSLGITLYFVIPRAPNFTFPSKDDILAVDEKSVQFSRTPANFSFDGSVQMRGKSTLSTFVNQLPIFINHPRKQTKLADASASYLPVHLSTLAVEIRHKDSSKQIASGEIRNYVLPRNRQVDVDVPVKWEYTGANSSDTTCTFLLSF